MVPNGWSLIKLKDIGKCINGLTYSPKNVVDNGLLVLRSSNVQGAKLAFDDNVYVNIDIASDSKTKVGDILLCVRNGSKNLIGKSAFIDESAEGLAHGAFMSLFRSNNTPNYTFQLFQSSRFFQQVNQNLGATINSINSGNLNQFKFPYPPLAERKKIAQILSTWDRGIATTEKLIDASKQQKKALMQQLLTGKKRLINPETGKAFEGEWRKSKTPYESLPSDWSELALEKLSSFITKGATPTTYGFEWQEYGIPFLRSECVGKNGFKESGLNYICDAAHEAMARSKVYAGDILITITGNVGRVCRLPNKYPQANINQHIAKVTLKNENVCNDFIFHCLQDNKYQSNFERITTGQAYPQISLVQVRNTIIPLPPISEQQKIASVLTAADKEIELLEAKLAHFKQEKKALMQQLLTGKRRVNIAETKVTTEEILEAEVA
ncbi:TPA: restriction endonuclease subunit S [Photobacterium damselae]